MKVGKIQDSEKSLSKANAGERYSYAPNQFYSKFSTCSAVQTFAASVLSSPYSRGNSKSVVYSPGSISKHSAVMIDNCSFGLGLLKDKSHDMKLEIDDSFQPTRSELVDLVASCQTAREERKRTGAKITWSGR